MNIGIDLMANDNGVSVFKEALEQSSLENVSFTVYGSAEACSVFNDSVNKVVCNSVIEMNDGLLSIRRKKDSSMMVMLNDLSEGKIDGALSAGSSGALLVGAMSYVGLKEGIERGCFVAGLPTKTDKPVYLVDMGANSECTSTQLAQFGVLGNQYALSQGCKNPKVALLNIGTEENKGDSLHKEAYKLLKEMNLNFVGNIEGRDILNGEVDVVVTDGFSGNIALKSLEGTAYFMFDELKNVFQQNLFTKLCALVLKKQLKALKNKADYSTVGGACIAGFKKPIVKAHGSSNAKAIDSAIKQIVALVRNKEFFEL